MNRTSRSWYLAIEGVIGVGKTTLARMLQEELGSGLLLEVFEENPFLSSFYSDRARYAFQTQMFFLLSLYRQQREGVSSRLATGPLISDYVFAKDWLFARLNLSGNEWEMYQRIHQALAAQIRHPDLIIYLQASLDILMGRIALRDRPYERDMDRSYIESLRHTYERFFAENQQVPVLPIETDDLNFVLNAGDFRLIVDRIRGALREGIFQQPLPHFETAQMGEVSLEHGRPLSDYQRFHNQLDRDKHFNTDPYFNFLCLSEEIGELGSEFAKLWLQEATLVADGKPLTEARQEALDAARSGVESELADCMAYLLKLANYAGVDLETAYLTKMQKNRTRNWRDSPKVFTEKP